MKKYIIILTSLFVSFSLWCTWEGNGLAGAATDFAEDGMFVKSSLLPKYSLVEVTNLENDIKVRAIVLDGKDVPGILMSFSPSVAEALKVGYGKMARIRVMSPNAVEEGDSFARKVPEEESGKVALKEETVKAPEKKEETPKTESPLPIEKENGEDVILYDFKPVAKNVEKKEKAEGIVSFNPAFIEEEVVLNIHLPETPIKEKTEPEVLPKKEKMEDAVVVKKEEKKVIPVVPPKIVASTEKKKVFLETVALRPPKEVAIPKMKDDKVPEKIAKVGDAPFIKNSDEDDITKKDETRDITVHQVKEVRKPVEEKEEPLSPVGEVGKIVPKKEESKKIEDVSSAPIIIEKMEEKKESVEAVKEVGMPRAKKSEEKEMVARVPVVPAIKQAKMEVVNPEPMEKALSEAVPLENDVVEETSLIEENEEDNEDVEEKIEEEDMAEEEEEPVIEEEEETVMEEEPEMLAIKVLDEWALKEIEVRGKKGRLNEEPSRERVELPGESKLVAIDNDELEKRNEQEESVREKALEEVSVENKKEEVKEIKKELGENETSEKTPVKKEIKQEEPIKKAEIKKEVTVKQEEPIKKAEIKKEVPVKKEEPKEEGKKKEKSENFPLGKIVKGYSYVQIGVFGNMQRVEDLLKKYGSSYPLVVEKRTNASKTNYVVFVGPLQKGEVGAVQESFRHFGFKDAF